MKTTVLTAAMVLAMPAFAFAQDKCYDDAKNQGDLNECADAAFKKSDKKLNELYKQIEARLKDDADTRKLLVQAQRDWVKFRDAECSFQTAGAAGGSMMPMLVAQCMDILTQSRIKNFQGYLNCEEGDMSCPVPAAAAPVAAAPVAAVPAAAIPAAAVLAAAVLAAAIPAAAAAPAAAVPAPARGEMGFDINVTLSKKAAAELAAEKEGIVAFASYFGDPKQSAEKHGNEIGQISVSPEDEDVEISGSGGHAHISGTKVDTRTLQWVEGDVEVNVNVATARKSNPPNILDCDFIEGAVADVRKNAPITLHCYLIEEEHPDTKQKP